MSSTFVLDTNVFVSAYRSYYPFDLAPSFWGILLRNAAQGLVVSVDRVESELNHGNTDEPDALALWAREHSTELFASTGELDVMASYGAVMKWANNQPYLPAAKAEFASLDVADAWVVAFAKARDFTVVTLERSEPKRKNRVKIPDACIAMGVEYTTTFEMLRRLGERLS